MSTTSVSITIKGKKVQGIGYRPFLLEKAVRLKIKNFDAVNIESEDEIDNEDQTLIVYVSGEDKKISDFVEFVKSKKGRPKMAEVDSIEVNSIIPDAYLEDVITIEEYKSILSAEQQNKTVQGGLLINKKMDTMIGKMDTMIGKQEETIGEIMNLRNDLKSHFDKRFEILEKDVFLIKKKMCIA